MAQVIFRSKHSMYRVHFDPKRFGLMDSPDGDDYATDVNGNVVMISTDDPQNPGIKINVPVRRKVPKPAAQFQDSMLALDDTQPMQKVMIQDLRKVIEGKVLDNKGQKFCRPDELWEEDAHTSQLVNQLNGAVIMALPEVFDERDMEILKGLENYFHNPIPRPALNNAMALLEEALKRFNVRGLVSPSQERMVKQLRPRIIDLVYALQDAASDLKMELPFDLEQKAKAPDSQSA